MRLIVNKYSDGMVKSTLERGSKVLEAKASHKAMPALKNGQSILYGVTRLLMLLESPRSQLVSKLCV